MKNVFVLPTDKPSRVYLIKSNNRLGITSTNPEYMENFGSGTQNQHLYITSDEEIKDCFVINIHTNQVYFLDGYYGMQPRTKKIILTTDGDLIKEGIQSIDDEFLNWFVQNPSCEEIGVLTNNMKNADYIEVAERLYKYINPTSKMDCPNSVYITTEKWYYEWLNIETDLDLFDWCVKFKNK